MYECGRTLFFHAGKKINIDCTNVRSRLCAKYCYTLYIVTDQNYVQVEKEVLAIIFGIKKISSIH